MLFIKFLFSFLLTEFLSMRSSILSLSVSLTHFSERQSSASVPLSMPASLELSYSGWSCLSSPFTRLRSSSSFSSLATLSSIPAQEREVRSGQVRSQTWVRLGSYLSVVTWPSPSPPPPGAACPPACSPRSSRGTWRRGPPRWSPARPTPRPRTPRAGDRPRPPAAQAPRTSWWNF